jgi:hypothetical protein
MRSAAECKAACRRAVTATPAVIDYRGEPVNVEFGIGHGFTAASDALILKLIVSRNF